jgi:hypothetical protein
VSTDHTFTTLRTYERTCTALLADPDVTGDLLLIGLWLARAIILRDPAPGEGRWSFAAMAATLFGTGRPQVDVILGEPRKVPNHLIFKVKEALRKDVPRYDVALDNLNETRCGAPMPRAPFCRRSVVISGYEPDASTGRRVTLAVCGRKDHQVWYAQTRAEAKAAVTAVGDHMPQPAANAGGALARHIALRNWDRVYRMVSPDWKPPAEGAPTRKPSLSVLRNDDFEPAESGTRPALVVHEGGWR